jgi:hypothetical protein
MKGKMMEETFVKSEFITEVLLDNVEKTKFVFITAKFMVEVPIDTVIGTDGRGDDFLQFSNGEKIIPAFWIEPVQTQYSVKIEESK